MRTATKLKLASLEDMETSHDQQTRPLYHQQNQGRFPDQESKRLPRVHSHVAQILYAKDVYKNYPAWKRWAANNVHIPLFRFLEKWLKLFPPTGKKPDGTYVWASHQGCFFTQEEADADAARYPHGYVVPNMPLGRSLTADVAEESSIYFASKGKPVKLKMVFEEMRKLQEEVRMAAVRMI